VNGDAGKTKWSETTEKNNTVQPLISTEIPAKKHC
jgi:hypothetical protein